MRYALIIVLLCSTSSASVEYKRWYLQNTVVHLVVSDLSTESVQVVLAQNTDPGQGLWRSESLPHMVNRLHPQAALSGPYFNMQTNIPVCTIVQDGHLLVDALCHSVLMVNGCARIHYNHSGKARDIPWPMGLPVGLAGGPILVQDGQLHPNKRDEGFRDPGIFGSARRTAVGITKAGKLVLLSTNRSIGLKKWSLIALNAGLTDAVNMDGGGSAGLYAQGKYVVMPSRRLTSFLVVK